MTTIELPTDTKPSRLTKTTAPVSGFDPDDIATVDDKIREFWATYPDGRVDTSDIKNLGDGAWRVTAFVWKNGDTNAPDSSASATRAFSLDGHVSEAHPLESAQSVALGRALRFLGIHGTNPTGGGK